MRRLRHFLMISVFKDQDGNNLVHMTRIISTCRIILTINGISICVIMYVTTQLQVPILEDDSVLIDKGTGLVMCCTFGDTMQIAMV